MAQYVKSSQNTVASLTNHGLIKLLVLRALAHHNLTWEQFVPRPRVVREPLLEIEGIGEESDEPRSSGLAEGRDGKSRDQFDNVQEEGVREAVEAAMVEALTTEAAMTKVGHYIEKIEGGEVEVLNVESSTEIRGTIIQEEEILFKTRKVSEFSIPSSENVEFPISRTRRKRPSFKGQTSIPAKRRRTGNSTTTKVVHVIGEM